jgi:hypothetical protein
MVGALIGSLLAILSLSLGELIPGKTPKDFGIKNPKPDIVYGFQRTAFTEQEQIHLQNVELELSSGIQSPFLTVQWKGFDGCFGKGKARFSTGWRSHG